MLAAGSGNAYQASAGNQWRCRGGASMLAVTGHRRPGGRSGCLTTCCLPIYLQAVRALFGGGNAATKGSVYDFTVKSIDGRVCGCRGAGLV